MKKYVISSLIVLLIFVVTASFTLLFFVISQGAFLKSIGLNKSLSLIIIFLVLFFKSWLFLFWFKKIIGSNGVLITMSIVFLALVILNLSAATIKYTVKISPFYIIWISGVVAGYLFYTKKKYLLPIILLVFPTLMAIGGNNLWTHRIEYGNWTGEVVIQKVAPFQLYDKAGEVINNESLKGKLILFDFWFISCGPCWKKFPEVQRIYEKYKTNPLVEIYAVNRPMKRDKTGELFSRIEDKEYTFPVLAGTQEIMDALNVYKYPTVMIINQNGEMVFMGELEAAEKKLELLLNE